MPPKKPTGPAGRLLSEFMPLLPAEERLREACRTGELARFSDARPEDKTTDNHIRPGVLRVFCLGLDPTAPVHERGVRVRGAWIAAGDVWSDDDLNLSGCDLPRPLSIWKTHFAGTIFARDASARHLEFQDSRCGAIFADRLKCTGGVFLRRGFIAEGSVQFLGATIDGSLVCTDATFAASKGDALAFDGAKIGGSVVLDGKFRAEREVRFLGAAISGNLECSDGTFAPNNGDALSFDRAKIDGNVVLDGKFSATREVRFLGATIGGNLECTDGNFSASDGDALSFDTAKIGGNAFLNGKFRAEGTVRFPNASIGGDLVCNDATFAASKDHALSFDNAKVDGDVVLKGEFRAEGTVRFHGAVIGGNLACSDATFATKTGRALSFDSAKIGGSVYLNKKFRTESTVRFLSATIGGSLVCQGGNFTSLTLLRAEINDTAYFGDGFRASGSVDLRNAEIAVFVDDETAWDSATLRLDGLALKRFGGDAPVTAAARIRWLEHQRPEHLGDDFRPQPWEECARVLAEMGHERDARLVRIKKRRHMRMLPWRRAKSVGDRLKAAIYVCFDYILDIATGYGWRPWNALVGLLILWAIASYGYKTLPPGVMAPADALVYFSPRIPPECKTDWITLDPRSVPLTDTRQIAAAKGLGLPNHEWRGLSIVPEWKEICSRAMPSEYSTFSPVFYALDVLLPIVDLRQENDWSPRVTDAAGEVIGRF